MSRPTQRIGAILAPHADWEAVRAAARVADDLGFDAVALWDHYHSGRPEWGYLAGWSLLGALAAATRRVRLVHMVLNNLHYEPGVLAKESTSLAIASDDRFELGIGAGDWPESFAAWGRPYPDRVARLELLEETVTVLRQLWRGAPVSFDGRHVRLADATCTPVPARTPRVVVGVGGSRTALRRAIGYADEVNVYADQPLVEEALRLTREAGRPVGVSLFVGWEWDKWPQDPPGELRRWRELGVDRVFVSLAGDDMPARLRSIAPAEAARG